MYNGAPIAWKSELQSTVATSSCEAELMALSAAAKEALLFGSSMRNIVNTVV
jgi:hypothetical protein